MKNEDIIANAIIIVGGVLCIKYVVIPLISVTSAGIESIGNQIQFKKRMKKGIKEGTIVKIDGKFYEVELDVEEA